MQTDSGHSSRSHYTIDGAGRVRARETRARVSATLFCVRDPSISAAFCARTSLTVLGATSVVTQLVCLREILSTFGGNEIAAALALGLWLFLTGAGSRIGSLALRRSRSVRGPLALGHLGMAFLPFLLLAGLRAVPLVAGVRGALLGLSTALTSSLVLFLPFGLLSGAMIPWAAALLRLAAREEDVPRRAYAYDSLGSAAGGLLFSLLLVGFLPHIRTLAIAAGANLAAAVLLGRARARILLPSLALVTAMIVGAAPLDRASLSWRFPGQKLLLQRNTPFGQIVVTGTGAQRNVFQDAIPLYSSGDLRAEARVHPALAQAGLRPSVLLIGGGVFGLLREVRKHEPSRVDYLELDPAIFELGELGAGLDDPAVRAIVGDGRRFLGRRGEAGRYDAILLDLPGPQNAGLNRFYTEEFFREARTALRPGGVLSFHVASSANYLGAEQVSLERSIHAALAVSFPEIAVLAGEEHIYIAGDRPFDPDLEPLLASRGVETSRLLDYDWPELSDPLRRDELAALLAPAGPPNRDFSPRAFHHLLRQEARKSGGSLAWLWVLSGGFLLLAALATRGQAAGIAVATSGFAAMALEVAVLLLFQILFGHLYLRMSLFVTLFLIGAAAGAWLSPKLRLRARAQMAAADAAIAGAAALLLVLALLGNLTAARESWLAQSILPVLLLVPAVAAGAQFAAASRARDPQILGRLYLADLAGAASGTMITGLLLLPTMGLAGVAASVVGVKLVSLIAARGSGDRT